MDNFRNFYDKCLYQFCLRKEIFCIFFHNIIFLFWYRVLVGIKKSPTYHHHRLITDDLGKRLAKRDDARALSKYRAEGATPADIRRMVGLPNP